MEEEFYNAFATPVTPATVAEVVHSENETGTYQKPPKLMYIQDFKGWQNRFENWVQAYKFDAWCSLDVDYVKPKDERGNEKAFSDYSDGEKLKYTSEKMMISILQQAVKEDIFEMRRLEIKKEDDEWVDKLADALPQNKWGTYLLILKHMRKSENMNLAKFIQKIEEHELDVQKTAIMNNPNAQQDVSLYYRGSKFETTPSPKIKTAFSANGSSGTNGSIVTQSGGYSSSFSSFDPNFTTQSPQRQNSTNLQCNVTLNIQNGQNLSPELAKQHMASLVSMLESYESLVAGRIGNPMLTKEDYDQIDAEELELIDIKWCLASAVRRAEKFTQITGRDDLRDIASSIIGFDKLKVTCFRCKEKGHFKRECKNKEATERKDSSGKNDYYQKSIFHQIEQQPSSSRAIEDGKKKAYLVNQDDEKVAVGFSWDKYIPPGPGLVAQILKEESVKTKPKRIPIFSELGIDADTVMKKNILIKLDDNWILTVLICFFGR
ncbi:putative transcription factor interactor and regulator CCHC(Zn) family [Helianthus annuus]|nr:putative transcription factor interactor and regulator CCHC(Zn) family [Helianthus annuus]